MTIVYTQMNVVVGDYEIWKREVSEGKMAIELQWIVTSVGKYPDTAWEVWHRDSNYTLCLEWVKETVKQEKEAEQNDNEN